MDQVLLTNIAFLGCVGIYLGFVLWTNLPHQPKGLAKLFFAEMWERFSFYGMRALLILYLTAQVQNGGMAYNDKDASKVYAAYGSLVYATPLIGGIIADRLLGNRRAIFLGGTLMALGHFVLALPGEIAFYCALALLILGNGFFKPNISSLVGKLYEENDPRRDAGFTLFYMGVNTGAMMAPLLCGHIGETYGWHYGFGLAGIGMVVGLVVFVLGSDVFGDRGLAPNEERLHGKSALGISNHHLVWTLAFLAVPAIAWMVKHNHILEVLVPGVILGGMGYMLFTAMQCEQVERERLFTLMGLFFFSVLFWAFFEQAGSSISLFTKRNVDRHLFGKEMATSAFQSVNALMIVVLGPLFVAMWARLAKVNLDPATPLKFALALAQVGLGFGVLVLGARSASAEGLVSVWFLLGAYLLHTTGELCLSPVGLSMVTKLAPQRIVGFAVGFWYLASSLAHHVGGVIAALMAVDPSKAASATPVETLPVYSGVFGTIAMVAIGASVFLFLISPVLRRWMHGVR